MKLQKRCAVQFFVGKVPRQEICYQFLRYGFIQGYKHLHVD